MDPISLFGHLKTSDGSDGYKSLKIRVIPCNQHAYYDEKNQFTIDEKCNSDLKEQRDAIGSSIEIRLLYNQQKFDPTMFGKDKIVKESKLKTFRFVPSEPSQTVLGIQQLKIEDETDLVQFGQTDEQTIYRINELYSEESKM